MTGTILTNDPSLTAWGWAVLDLQGNIIKTGCIKTEPAAQKRRIRKGDDYVKRIGELDHVLRDVITNYNVIYLLAELPFGAKSAQSAKMAGMVPGVLTTWSYALNIGIEWYMETDVKKYLFNSNKVAKEEMVDLIASKFDIQWPKYKKERQAVADALGVYLTAIGQSEIVKFLNK